MNEIRNVKVGSSKQDPSWGMWPNHRELARFGEAFWNAMRSVAVMAWRLIRLRPILAPRPVQTEHLPPRAEPQGFSTSRALTPIHDDLETERDLYRRFLSGENLSDDEEDFSPRYPSVAPESDGEEPGGKVR